MIIQVRRWWKCDCCNAVVDHFRYKYDWGPAGEDESVCPNCGIDAGFMEVPEDKWEITKVTEDKAGFIYDIKCTKCGHHETVRKYPWPSRCYVCAEE